MTATATTAEAAQKARNRREKEARHRFYEERERRAREAPCRTGCLHCDWSFQGTAEEGQWAARAHRCAEHPDLPERASKRRGKTAPRVHAASWKEQEQSRREQNREALLRAVETLGAVWASVSEVADAAGLTPNETGRHLRAEGYERVRYRQGRTQFWLGTGAPPTPRRVCALDGCDTEFVPASNVQRYCSTAHRNKTYR